MQTKITFLKNGLENEYDIDTSIYRYTSQLCGIMLLNVGMHKYTCINFNAIITTNTKD